MVTWETIDLGSVGDFSKGRGISKDEAHSGKIPCVRYGEIYTHHNDYVKTFHSHISETVADTSRRLRTGELLFAGSGETKEDIGKCVAFVDDCEAYAGGDIVILTPRKAVDSLFLGYYLNSRPVAEQKASRGQGDAIVHISARSLAEIEIQLPPLPEQLRIAAALTDTDALLAAMEKLIAKKRAIKQGAIQELLTGTRRLPGFEGEWVEKKLESLVVSAKSGGTPLTSVASYYDGYIPFLSINDMTVQGKYLRYASNKISQEGLDNSASWVVPVDCLIYSMYASVGFVSIAKISLAISQAVLCLEVNEDNDTEFLYYLLSFIQPNVFKYVGEGTQKNLNAKAVRNFELFLPPTTIEQTAIAEILSDMDAEIDALTAKLNKLRNIKQGMMSELLTGRIRLVDSHTAKAMVVTYPEQATEPIRKVAEDTAPRGHNQQFDDAVMIAGIVNALYSSKYPLGRKKVQKCLYLLRRHQDERTEEFKKKAAGPYSDEVRYKGGEPIAKGANYIATTTGRQGTTFAPGKDICKALGYIQSWGREADINWVADKLKFKSVDELELLATVDMAICDLTEAGSPVSVQSIKHLIATNAEWKEKLNKQTFSDANIARAIRELSALL